MIFGFGAGRSPFGTCRDPITMDFCHGGLSDSSAGPLCRGLCDMSLGTVIQATNVNTPATTSILRLMVTRPSAANGLSCKPRLGFVDRRSLSVACEQSWSSSVAEIWELEITLLGSSGGTPLSSRPRGDRAMLCQRTKNCAFMAPANKGQTGL